MPTGYTYPVRDGKVTEFRDFVLSCARAFTMHDSDAGPVPRELPPRSTYYDEALADSYKTLGELEGLTGEQIEVRAVQDYAVRLSSWCQCRLERARGKKNYEAMIEKVRAWTPPTTEHEGLKKFMLEQLQTSIKFDCSSSNRYDKAPERQTPVAWINAMLEETQHEIEYRTKALAEEIERYDEKSKWLGDLYISLGPSSSTERKERKER